MHQCRMWQQQLITFALIWLTVNGKYAYADRTRYDNYHVYQLQPSKAAHLNILKALDDTSDDLLFLDPVQSSDAKLNVLVAPQRIASFLATLEKADLSYKLMDENAQRSLDREVELVADSNWRVGEYTWTRYHELNDTYAWLRALADKYPEQVSLFVAGKSYEGREILGVKIAYESSNKANKATAKRGIFIECGMHAREWISPATTTYIINQLLTNTDSDVRKVAESFVWYVVPHANPDGYVYTHTTNRLWRKTRTPYGRGCFGADPNRNWDFHWNEVGSSNNPCSDTYAGPKAFSELETRSLAEYISTLKGELFLYLSFHSYSQLLLFPYGHTSELPPNYKDLKRVFDVAIAAVSKRYGTRYTGGNVYDAIYPAAGSSLDWAYGQVDVPYSYCFELRPAGSTLWTGFRLPAEQIIPTGEEIMDSMLAMVKEIGQLEAK